MATEQNYEDFYLLGCNAVQSGDILLAAASCWYFVWLTL
jgi:hypothetical protein